MYKPEIMEKNTKRVLLLLVAVILVTAIQGQRVLGRSHETSPNGKLQVQTVDKKLVIKYKDQKVLELADIQFGKLKFVKKVTNDYQMLAGKRRRLFPFLSIGLYRRHLPTRCCQK